MKKIIRLVALDMDGTLFNNQSQISEENQKAIRSATAQDVTVAISTGRPYIGLPVPLLAELGIRYAITSGGAAIYRLPERKCIYQCCMEPELICPIIEELQKMDIHMDASLTATATADIPADPESTGSPCRNPFGAISERHVLLRTISPPI